MSKDEFMDEELAGMVSYTDETVPTEMPVMEHKPAPKEEPKHADVRDAEYTPVPVRNRNDMGRLKGCVKWLLPCGGICTLLFVFWLYHLMAAVAAFPCIFVSGCIGWFGVGMNVRK